MTDATEQAVQALCEMADALESGTHQLLEFTFCGPKTGKQWQVDVRVAPVRHRFKLDSREP